ncbi:MAG: flavodoxin-dependent (E)-4-hydroxy-3-methylbut-2-enyl-diphosphate synthase, partial [Ruminococcus sp.]|nr:flavodoxin-dependent (E)-4-hydroxy-3-methylbut-2-enyl-diphosphate synthase [Candidatus Apopatosoma intestinale]
KRIPIRIGVNSGSLEKELLAKYGAPTAEALAESAMGHIKILESLDFFDIAVSIKSSDVFTMVKANKILASMCDYPLHLGVTEAGRGEAGCLKSALGLGALLTSGIGDTVRVSLTDKPESEIEAARNILKALSLYDGGYINIISCPTCGRTKIDLISLCERLEKLLSGYKPNRKITLAVMGCVVNGPGEAREADIGIAGGAGEAVLFRRGEIIRKIKEENILEELEAEIAKLCQNRA